MYLNIILTILVVTLLTILVSVIVWWKKYGKELFSLLINIKNMNQGNKINNPMSDMTNLMSELENISNIFGNFKK
jgi:hypothetical protein